VVAFVALCHICVLGAHHGGREGVPALLKHHGGREGVQGLLKKASKLEQEYQRANHDLEEDGFVWGSTSGGDGSKQKGPGETEVVGSGVADPRRTEIMTPLEIEGKACPRVDDVLCDGGKKPMGEGTATLELVHDNFILYSARHSIAKPIDLYDALRLGAMGETEMVKTKLQTVCQGRPVFREEDGGEITHAAVAGTELLCKQKKWTSVNANAIAPALAPLIEDMYRDYMTDHLIIRERCRGPSQEQAQGVEGRIYSCITVQK